MLCSRLLISLLRNKGRRLVNSRGIGIDADFARMCVAKSVVINGRTVDLLWRMTMKIEKARNCATCGGASIFTETIKKNEDENVVGLEGLNKVIAVIAHPCLVFNLEQKGISVCQSKLDIFSVTKYKSIVYVN